MYSFLAAVYHASINRQGPALRKFTSAWLSLTRIMRKQGLNPAKLQENNIAVHNLFYCDIDL